MIATLIIIYIILKYIVNMEKELLYKIMLIVCLVNIIPTIIYTIYALSFGEVNYAIIFLMTLI